ncbi:MAG: tetratricopeptide repeat protein [Myxococcales bacterium]|nr:tetratricopeptide repeat protein [Myxococcales bacterium]MCB9716353.1 tetratricopeptide repeat protein [Myxococcales bacterium]
MRTLRLAPVLLAALMLVPGCDNKKELTPEEIAAKLESDLEEAAARVRNNKLEDAEKIYLRVLETHPDHPKAVGGLGRVRLEEKKYEEAETLLAKAVAATPDDARLMYALGTSRMMQGKHAEAAEAYGQAFAADPENSEFGLSYGRQLKEAGSFAKAEEVLREVAELDPKAQFVFTELGDALRGQSKNEEALRTYMKAQNTYRSDKMAHAGAALTYELLGDNKHAADEWAAYITMDCCSDFSKTVAQKKIVTLEAGDGAAAEGGEAPGDEAAPEGAEQDQAG